MDGRGNENDSNVLNCYLMFSMGHALRILPYVIGLLWFIFMFKLLTCAT